MVHQLCVCVHITVYVGTNLIHGKKMRDFTVEFLKCAKFHGKFTEGVEKFTDNSRAAPAVISRCYVNAE